MPPLITVKDLRKRFNLEAGFFAPLGKYVYAVNGLSFHIGENESYGLVGESGCGKTTAARLLVRMYEASGGVIRWREQNIAAFKRKDLAAYREKVKYVFQDPARSLNPRMNVYDILTSGRRFARHGGRPGRRSKAEERAAAAAILTEVGLSPEDLQRRPAEFSGGQRQRISIARGLFAEPELLICDEVVSALDVSIQAQILNLLLEIRRRRNLSFLFIAHDLRVASWFCDRIGVMYRGELMEEGPAAELWRSALHPYTALLFSSIESEGTSKGDEGEHRRSESEGKPGAASGVIPGEVGSALEELPGCAFAGRCPHAEERCRREKPDLREIAPDRRIRCFNFPAG